MSTTMEFDAGTSINEASERSAHRAYITQGDVAFAFNGLIVVAKPGDPPATIANRYHVAIDERHRQYLASPKGRRDARQRNLQIADRQKQADELEKNLPQVLQSGDGDALVRWLVDLSVVADDVAVKKNTAFLAGAIMAFGWKCNDATHMAPRQYTADRSLAVRYLVGQALDCMMCGKPPHPIIQDFAPKMLPGFDAEIKKAG